MNAALVYGSVNFISTTAPAGEGVVAGMLVDDAQATDVVLWAGVVANSVVLDVCPAAFVVEWGVVPTVTAIAVVDVV